MEYSKLTTGNEFRLSELFSKDNKVIIPDLQRDYCWGTKQGDKELVSDFIHNIIDNGFNKGTDLSLGLIYGYETPIGHIQLCDGQQRITTLFLLLGMVNKYSRNAFRERLISLFEYDEDDKEPYLQYSIRESSLYFISDLVCHFFIADNNLRVEEISKQNWYFSDYDLDPSIQSMISAMRIIEKEVKEIDYLKFGTYLVEKLTFVYYNMGNRAHGEETFVVINTTGEPLSATENLKPLFISVQREEEQKETSEKWEEWETWFWKHRKGSGAKENDTAENGYREFFRWITLLKTTDPELFKRIQETGDFKFDTGIRVVEIEEYFKVVNFLFEDSGFFSQNLDWLAPDRKDNNINNQIVWFRLLPVIGYIKKFGKNNLRNILRVKTFFDHLSRIENVAKSVGTLFSDALQIIKNLDSEDIAFTHLMQGISSQILSLEEKVKFKLYLASEPERILYEDCFWKAEEHNIWSGEILPMISWSTVDGVFNLAKFQEFNRVFCSLFHDKLDYDELDITRRALLTLGLKDYPRFFRGSTNISFCRQPNDWRLVIKDNEVILGTLFNQLIPLSNIESELQKMIQNFYPGDKYDDFIKVPEVLKYCLQKNVQHSDKNGWILLRGEKMSGAHANLKTYLFFLELKAAPFWNEAIWNIDFYDHEGSCIFYTNLTLNIIIDVVYCGDDKYMLQVFRRKVEYEDVRLKLAPLAGSISIAWNGERYESIPTNPQGLIEIIKEIQDFPFVF